MVAPQKSLFVGVGAHDDPHAGSGILQQSTGFVCTTALRTGGMPGSALATELRLKLIVLYKYYLHCPKNFSKNY